MSADEQSKEDILLQLSMGKSALERREIEKKFAQENANSQATEEPTPEINHAQEVQTTPTVETQQEEIVTQEEVPQESVVQEEIIQESPTVMPSEEEIREAQQEEQEALLQKVAMPQQDVQEHVEETDKPFETRKDPYIYRKGHPHLGQNFSKETIQDLTKRMLSTNFVPSQSRKK